MHHVEVMAERLYPSPLVLFRALLAVVAGSPHVHNGLRSCFATLRTMSHVMREADLVPQAANNWQGGNLKMKIVSLLMVRPKSCNMLAAQIPLHRASSYDVKARAEVRCADGR